MKHIIVTVNAAWNVWNFRKPLVESLLAGGNLVTVLAPWDQTVPELESLGCRFINLHMNAKGINPLEGMILYRAFKKIFEVEKPDVVLSYTIKNNIFGAFAARSKGVPFLPNITGLGTAFLSHMLLEHVAGFLYLNAFKSLPIVFFQNNDDRDLFLSRKLVLPEQVICLKGSGIDLSDYSLQIYPRKQEPTTFLMIARLLKDKGIFEFVDAARQVKSQYSNVSFQLLGSIGSDNRSGISVQTLRKWEEEGVINYLGDTADVRPFISDAHCVVLPSYREGAPRTLLEASSSGRPVIATDVPGCRSVVDDGVTGLLCEVKSANSLAHALDKFYRLPHHEKRSMGLAARKKMEDEFDVSYVVSEYMAAINRVVL